MGLPALAADYLFLAPLIEARLKDKVPDMPVDVCETVEQVFASDQRAQALMVMWGGDFFPDSKTGEAGGGTSQILKQRWLVILALNNVARAKDARNSKAGPLLSKVHLALAGWTPQGALRPMRRANAPIRPDITPSKALYPLGFEVQLTL